MSLVYTWKFPTTVWSDFVTMPKHLIIIFHDVLHRRCCSAVATATAAQQQRAVIEDDINHVVAAAGQYSLGSNNLKTWLKHNVHIDIVPSQFHSRTEVATATATALM